MDQLYIHKHFLSQHAAANGYHSNVPVKTTLYHDIVQEIINRQRLVQGSSPAPVVCTACCQTIENEWHPEQKQWRAPGYHLAEGLCDSCYQKAIRQKHPERFLKAAHVPTKYFECSFENFKPVQTLTNTINICARYTLQEKFQRGLFLYGPCGTGKTHIAVAILRRLVSKGIDPLFTSVPNMLFEIRRAFQTTSSIKSTEEAYLKHYAGTPFLVLDDFGIEKTTDWNRQVLDYIIYERDNNRLPIIVTTNLSIGDIRQKIDARIASRLLDMTTILHFSAPDFRG